MLTTWSCICQNQVKIFIYITKTNCKFFSNPIAQFVYLVPKVVLENEMTSLPLHGQLVKRFLILLLAVINNAKCTFYI